jgi:cysteine-rich repeat protein
MKKLSRTSKWFGMDSVDSGAKTRRPATGIATMLVMMGAVTAACASPVSEEQPEVLKTQRQAIAANPILEVVKTFPVSNAYAWQSAFYNPLTGLVTLLEFNGVKYSQVDLTGATITPPTNLPEALGGVTDGADYDPTTKTAVVSNRTTPEFIEMNPTTLVLKSRRAISGITSFVHGISIRANGEIYTTDYTGPVNQVYSRFGTAPLRTFLALPSGNDCISFIQGSDMLVTGDASDKPAIVDLTGATITPPSAIGPAGAVIRGTAIGGGDGLTALKKTGLYVICNSNGARDSCHYMTLKCNANADCPVTDYTGCDLGANLCISPVCGDGKREAGEECDDGNKTSGDGCAAGCGAEDDFTCTGNAPSVCKLTDTDGDTLADRTERTLGTDPTVKDTDGDGLADTIEVGANGIYDVGTDTNPLDADTDNDGLKDGDEKNGTGPNAGKFTNPLVFDTDKDGLGDGLELGLTVGVAGGTSTGGVVFAGTTAFVADAEPASKTDPASADTDSDGLSDGVEDANHDGATINTIGGTGTGGTGESNPIIKDTDGDGLSDGDERGGAGPLAGTGIKTDPLDRDTDDGGRQDGVEVLSDKTNPTVKADDLIDTDSDGVADIQERAFGTDPNVADSDKDGIPDNLELSATGAKVGPFSKVDTDADGVIDALDTDSDGDGLSDADEHGPDATPRDTDSDGIPDYRDTDDDGDGIPTSVEIADAKSARTSDDTDGDGKPNWLDADSDGDRVADGDERADTNKNGVPDYLEKTAATTPAPGPGTPGQDAGVVSDAGSVEGGACAMAGKREGTMAWLVGVLAGVGVARRRRRLV